MTPERRNKLNNVLNKRQGNLTVVLENVFDPHNVSAVMRSCDAVGIQDIYILNTRIPPHKKWGFKSSSSANRWITTHQFDNTEECFSTLKQKFPLVMATHLGDNSLNVYEVDFTQSMALVFGNEHKGVSDEAMAYCNGSFIIPQVGIIESLNISVACAVTIYEAYRQKMIAGQYNQPSLPAEQRSRLLDEWGFKADDLAIIDEQA